MKLLMNTDGLSLLEVLIAMIILAIGVLGLAPMVVVSIEGNNMSQDVLTVSNLAKEKMEQFEAMNVLPAVPYNHTEAGLSGGYDRTTYLIDKTVDTTLPAGLKKLDVTISWTDKMGVDRSTTYSTYLEN